MLILSADTSSKNGSLALVTFGSGAPRTLELVGLEGGTFSAQLVPQISALLARQKFKKEDIDGFAVASGPGSFTGLRVGLAAIKALAEALQKPITTVSLLEAVARRAVTEGRVVAALDAGRGEVYAGIYEITEGTARFLEHQVATLAELIALGTGSRFVTPDINLADRLGADNLSVIAVPQPRADTIAALGFEKIEQGEVVSPESLDATYIRRSDAEIKFTSPTR